MLRGKPGTDISTLVANGSLDAFLPYNMRFSDEAVANHDKEQEAVEYIKDNLRARNYLSYETDLALRQLELTIQQLDSELSDQDLTELEQYIEGTTSEQTPATNEAQVTEEAGTAEERNNEAAQEPAQGEADRKSVV